VQIADAAAERAEPLADELGGQTSRVSVDYLRQRLAEDIFHYDPLLAASVGAEVVQMNEIGVLEVEAMGDAAEFRVGVPTKELESNLLAAVADREVHLAEPALTHAAFERVAVERPLSGSVAELHAGHGNPGGEAQSRIGVQRPLNK
jgi:hypothetical protein